MNISMRGAHQRFGLLLRHLYQGLPASFALQREPGSKIKTPAAPCATTPDTRYTFHLVELKFNALLRQHAYYRSSTIAEDSFFASQGQASTLEFTTLHPAYPTVTACITPMYRDEKGSVLTHVALSLLKTLANGSQRETVIDTTCRIDLAVDPGVSPGLY